MIEKFAVSDRAWIIETVVVAEPESFTPSPDHPTKSYPVSGLATMVVLVPWLKVPIPKTVPPELDARERA